ncbi:MAG TPA: lantibiotic dehydratase [Kofleriaceae bacterium]|nr:lantibiotic dehydratase [Kofleriaceae bacterium]
MTDPLHRLPGAGWALWRWAVVRGAGFPVSTLGGLVAPATNDAIERVLELEDSLVQSSAAAIRTLEADLAAGGDRPRLKGFLRKLRTGAAMPPTDGLSAPASAAIENVIGARDAIRVAREQVRETLDAELPQLGRAIRDAARDPRFREALTWQNRGALHQGIDVMLRHPETSAKSRRHERAAAGYLQRYCVKNDTIGFFGPVGWARIVDGATAIRPGRELLAKRTVYFEHWAIDTLASTIADDPLVRPHLAPRRHPFVWVEGTTLHHAIDRTTELHPEHARLLAACDGERSAREIAYDLLSDDTLDTNEEGEVLEILDELVDGKLALWTLEIPVHVEHPDRVLQQLLEAIPDPVVTAPWLAKLAELQKARDAVAAAAGDPDALDRALEALDTTFTRLTGQDAQRRSGQVYAGRTLVYEDCRRDLELELSAAIFDRASAPLSLLLRCARWFTYTLARAYRERFVALHAELAAETGSPTVDFLRFWERASTQFAESPDHPPVLVAETTAELQRRWAALLGLDDSKLTRDRILWAASELEARAATLFDAPHPGWPSARLHAPDLMIAASGPDAVMRGDLVLVLGELHIASATVSTPALARQHPRPDDIFAALRLGRPWPIVETVIPKERATRADAFSLLDTDFSLEFGTTRSRRERDHAIQVGTLVIEPAGASLQVRTRDRQYVFALEQFFDAMLRGEAISNFKLVPRVPHCPRITIDGVVVTRETWRFDPAQLAFVQARDAAERLLACRRWRRAHHVPRRAFYRVPTETKPYFVDFDCPHYVDQLAHFARSATELVVSEMLPDVEQVWLPDAAGVRYASELRVVAVDPEPWRP